MHIADLTNFSKKKNKTNKTRFGGKRFFYGDQEEEKTLPSKIPLKTEHSERAAATAVFITASRSGAARRLRQPGTAGKKKKKKKSQTTSKKCRSSGATRQRRP